MKIYMLGVGYKYERRLLIVYLIKYAYISDWDVLSYGQTASNLRLSILDGYTAHCMKECGECNGLAGTRR